MLIFLVQFSLYRKIRGRLLLLILFAGAVFLTLAWLLLCLFMPILWMNTMPIYAKAIAVTILLLLCAVNFKKGENDFFVKWNAAPDPFRIGNFDPVKKTIAWEKILLSLRQEPNLYIPGLPSRFSTAGGVLLAIFMLIGLNFRSAFPVFSAFAWGIPSAVATSFIFQLIGQKMGEARKVKEIQSELKIELQSAGR